MFMFWVKYLLNDFYLWFQLFLLLDHFQNTIKQTFFLQTFCLVAFIEQKENDNNDNLC